MEKKRKTKRERILVTGASGCVGASLIKDLAKKGHLVRASVFPNTWHPFLDEVEPKLLEVRFGNILDKAYIEKAVQGCTHVYHVAGIVSYNKIDDKKVHAVHVQGTRNILEAAKEHKIKKVVVTGSTAGIGIPKHPKRPLNEETPFDYKNYKKVMYMYSKHLCIKECQKAAKEGLNVSVISPTTIFGQGDVMMNIGKAIKKIKEGKLNRAPPGGNSVISVDDVVAAHQLVMEKGKAGENYIFANESLSYIELFNTIAKVLDKPKITKKIPAWTLTILKPTLTAYENLLLQFKKKPLLSPSALNFSYKYRYFDASKARKELGWQAKDSFEDAVKKAVAFYEKHNLL